MGMLGDRLSEQDYTSCTYQQYPTRYMEITVSKVTLDISDSILPPAFAKSCFDVDSNDLLTNSK